MKKIIKEQIIEDILRVKEIIGKIPTKKQYSVNGNHASATAIKLLGSWSSIIKAIFNKDVSKKPAKINKCQCCQKDTKNDKYCSEQCFAKSKNRSIKSTKLKKCKACDNKINRRKTYCQECKNKGCKDTVNGIIDNDVILSEVIYDNHHRSSAFSLVRNRARSIALKNNMKSCLICGYDKHIEICHIKPISSFSLDTKISEINHLSNLCPLCPNHHWEYDNGLITLPDKTNIIPPPDTTDYICM